MAVIAGVVAEFEKLTTLPEDERPPGIHPRHTHSMVFATQDFEAFLQQLIHMHYPAII